MMVNFGATATSMEGRRGGPFWWRLREDSDDSFCSTETKVLGDVQCSMSSLSDGSGPASESPWFWEPWLNYAM